MTTNNDFYLKSTPQDLGLLTNTNMYITSAPKHKVDLRKGLHDILFGDRYNPPQGRPVIVRHMTTVCPCITGATGGLPSDADKGQKYRDPDPQCSICQGEGYLFTESQYTAWRSTIDNAAALLGIYAQRGPGITVNIGYAFFFEYNVPIFNLDKIYEFVLDENGGMPPINPAIGPLITDLTVRRTKHKITRVIDYRSDNAEVDFYMAVCEQEAW